MFKLLLLFSLPQFSPAPSAGGSARPHGASLFSTCQQLLHLPARLSPLTQRGAPCNRPPVQLFIRELAGIPFAYLGWLHKAHGVERGCTDGGTNSGTAPNRPRFGTPERGG